MWEVRCIVLMLSVTFFVIMENRKRRIYNYLEFLHESKLGNRKHRIKQSHVGTQAGNVNVCPSIQENSAKHRLVSFSQSLSLNNGSVGRG